MKIHPALFAPTLALLLPACSGTPTCGDGDTKDLLDEIIEKSFQNNPYGRNLRPLVEYKVRAIHMLDHDKNTDSYECAATLELQADGMKLLEGDIEYDIYSVQDEDADFQIHYDDKQFNQIIPDAHHAKSMKQL